jgi:putative transcriptional regulator
VTSLTGRLLVATPVIGDPNFERTVIFLLAHGGEGAFGVVLNRPSETEVAEIVPAWAPLASPPAMMFLGGPVGRNAVVGLGRVAEAGPGERCQPVIDGVATVDLNQPPEATEKEVTAVRLFAGSAGWAAGQLDDELAEGAWWLVEPIVDDVFSAAPLDLWSTVLRRQRAPVSWFALHPRDPSAN